MWENLKTNKLGQQTVQYLGFCIGQGKVWAVPDNEATLREILLPPTQKELQQFLRLANFYRHFVPKFSSRAGPLTHLLAGKGKGTQPLQWTKEAKEALKDIRTALCTNAVLYAPLPNRPTCLYTDGSNKGLGAMLTQETPTGE